MTSEAKPVEAPVVKNTPKDTLEAMGIDDGVFVPYELAAAYRTAASRLRMKGMKFKTVMVDGGINVWRKR